MTIQDSAKNADTDAATLGENRDAADAGSHGGGGIEGIVAYAAASLGSAGTLYLV